MTCIYKFLNNKPNFKNKRQPSRGFVRSLFIWISTCLPVLAHSQALVTQVQGEVTVKLRGLPQAAKVTPGTLLTQQSALQFGDAKSQLWLLCPGQDKPVTLRAKEASRQLCPATESSKMRGGEDEDIPFLILPNQPALSTVDRVLWSGPKDAHFLIMLFQYDELGTESLVKEWSTENHTYHESGFHELRIEPPLTLNFPKNQALTYKIEIENTDTSQSSASFDEILISPISTAFPEKVSNEMQSLLASQKIDANSELGKLTQANYLNSMGYFAEAYGIASSLGKSDFNAAAHFLMAKALYQPGTPGKVVVYEFAKVLELAAATGDYTSAVVACEGLLSPSNNLLKEEVRNHRKKVVSSPRYAEYCKKY